MNRARLDGRAGVGAVQAVVALVLILFIIQVSVSGLMVAARQVRGTIARSDAIILRRLVRTVLQGELRAGFVGDWRAMSGDSVALRAFRSTALVCPDSPAGAVLLVHARGDRLADPAKDSILVLTDSGQWVVRALVDRRGSSHSCSTAPLLPLETWRLDASVPGAILLRLFETGTYSLGSGAFRYRRGRGGRQPLTAPRLDDARSSLTQGVSGVLRLTLGITAIPFAQGPDSALVSVWPRPAIP